MIKADINFIGNLREILDNGYTDSNPRAKYKDGTPAHTKYITQVFETYDLEKGEFPITTLRNTAILGGINEILTIFQNQENSQESFKSNSVEWWIDWMNSNGNLGAAYSHNIESHRDGEFEKKVIKVDKILIDEKFSKILDNRVADMLNSSDGEIYNEKYIIVGVSDRIGNGRVKEYKRVQFIDSGYISEIRKDQIGKSNGIDPYRRTVYGIGYLGEYRESCPRILSENDVNILKDKWENMFRRCYSKKYHSKKTYNGKFVHNRWHSFSSFLKDVCLIPQFHLAKEDKFVGWELDKDYYGSNAYSPTSCVFIRQEENKIYASGSPIIVSKFGVDEIVLSRSKFCEKNNLPLKYFNSCVSKNKPYRGYSFKKLNGDDIYRYELSRNQLSSLLLGLVENPYGRRHIISFWNWSNIDKKQLVECAYETIWTVRESGWDKVLDMTLIQRSSDYITAGYINKIQYVALQMMVAAHCGYKVGKFSHFVQNLHIYDRHIDAAKEILARTPKNFQPSIAIANEDAFKDSFYNITPDDFVIDYAITEKLNSPLELAV
jgi:thymidylate synthase